MFIVSFCKDNEQMFKTERKYVILMESIEITFLFTV